MLICYLPGWDVGWNTENGTFELTAGAILNDSFRLETLVGGTVPNICGGGACVRFVVSITAKDCSATCSSNAVCDWFVFKFKFATPENTISASLFPVTGTVGGSDASLLKLIGVNVFANGGTYGIAVLPTAGAWAVPSNGFVCCSSGKRRIGIRCK